MFRSEPFVTKEPKINFFDNSLVDDELSQKFLSFYSQIVEQVEEIEKKPDVKKDCVLKYYFLLEEEKKKEIKNTLQKKQLEEILRETLYEQFFRFNTSKRLAIAKKINKIFNDFLSKIDANQTDLKKYFNMEFDTSKDPTEIEKDNLKIILKEMENGMYDMCLSEIMQKAPSFEQIPSFLLNKALVKQKVDMIWKINYSIPVTKIKIRSNFCYTYLNEIFNNFLKTVTLIEKDTFDKGTLFTIFKSFFLSNLEKLSTNPKYLDCFLSKLDGYLCALNIYDDKDMIKKYVQSKLEDYKSKGNTNTVNEEIKVCFNDLKGKLINDFQLLLKGPGSEKMLLIIFAFSLILNDIVGFDEESKKITFPVRFQCSSWERIYLRNFLKKIDIFLLQQGEDVEFSNSTFFVNFCIENEIFYNFIKSYSTRIFDESLKYKIDLKYDTIVDYILSSDSKKEEDVEDIIMPRISQDEKETLRPLENNLAPPFYSNNIFISMFKSFLGEYQKFYKSQLPMVDKLEFKFIPHDPLKISTHICIVINDYFDITILNQLNNENKLVDFYYYSWNSQNNSASANLLKFIYKFLSKIVKKPSLSEEENFKYAGKFLAYMICSREVFTYNTFSFICLGKGCSVMKHFVNEMVRINMNSFIFEDAINDILYVNGQCSLDDDELLRHEKVVSGRVINVYSPRAGSNLIGNKEIQSQRFENYDVGYLHLDYQDYKYNLCNIINKVKMF